MSPALYIRHTDQAGKPVRVPTDPGLAAFVLLSGSPLALCLAWNSSFTIQGIVSSWVFGAAAGIRLGAVRHGVLGAFNGGLFCALGGVLVMVVTALSLGPAPLMPALGLWCFTGPLIVGVHARQKTQRLPRAQPATRPAPPPPVLHVPSVELPYPSPPEALQYLMKRAGPRGAAGRRRPS